MIKALVLGLGVEPRKRLRGTINETYFRGALMKLLL